MVLITKKEPIYFAFSKKGKYFLLLFLNLLNLESLIFLTIPLFTNLLFELLKTENNL